MAHSEKEFRQLMKDQLMMALLKAHDKPISYDAQKPMFAKEKVIAAYEKAKAK